MPNRASPRRASLQGSGVVLVASGLVAVLAGCAGTGSATGPLPGAQRVGIPTCSLRAVVTLRLLVLNERSPEFTVLFTAEKSARVSFDPAAATAASQAFGTALTQTLEALTRALAAAPLPRAE